MLVIKPRCGAHGMGRYTAATTTTDGSGIFDSITRKMFATGLKKAISTGANSVIAHKISDAVVNGATSASQKAVESAVNEAVNTVKPIVKESLKKLVGQKRHHRSSSPSATKIPVVLEEIATTIKKKKPNIDINSLIDGSGIIFD
jgi:hypothetical protein